MQQIARPVFSADPVDAVSPTQQVAAGPVPIDLQLLKLIAGGGGTPVSFVEDPSPKGGWA